MIDSMRKIGVVKLVQIQLDRLAPNGVYNPIPLVSVASLNVTFDGVVGIFEDGRREIDVHNATHPNSRYRRGNKLSFGFVGHYNNMREYFGPHLRDGIAGENIIIDTSEAPDIYALGEKIAVHKRQTGQTIVMDNVFAIDPCDEFSTFALNQEERPPASEIKAAIQFLSDGTRGFCAQPTSFDQPVIIQPGDVLYVSGKRRTR